MEKNIVETLLDDVESLIKDMEDGFKSPNTRLAAASKVLKQVRNVRSEINSNTLELRFNKTYWIFWSHDSISIATGSSISDALSGQGYGAGAAHAIDFYMFEPTPAQMVKKPPSFPDSPNNKKFVMETYVKGIRDHLDNLKESVPEKDFVHALEDFYVAYLDNIVLTKMHPQEQAEFMEIHLSYVKNLNPQSRHGKMYFERFFERSQDGALHQKLEPYPTEGDTNA